jgi:hypothetical protein
MQKSFLPFLDGSLLFDNVLFVVCNSIDCYYVALTLIVTTPAVMGLKRFPGAQKPENALTNRHMA